MRARARTDDLKQRNERIGSWLRQVRIDKGKKIEDCAKHIETSRQRYGLMEKGSAIIGVAELISLLNFLEVPMEQFVGVANASGETTRLVEIGHGEHLNSAHTAEPYDQINVQLPSSALPAVFRDRPLRLIVTFQADSESADDRSTETSTGYEDRQVGASDRSEESDRLLDTARAS